MARPTVTGRNRSLDALRGIAVLLVIIHHYAAESASFLHIGMVGVDLFFVLSGFLISGLLFSEFKKTGKICLWRFFVRRGLKIYPAFYVFLLLTLPITRNVGSGRFWSEVFFLQSYQPHFWQHTWSLSVEEMFYLALPLLLLLLLATSKNFAAVPWIGVCLIILCSFLRSRVSVQSFSRAHLRADALFAGVALGYYRHFRPEIFMRVSRAKWLLPLALLFLLPCFFGDHSGVALTNLPLTASILGFSGLVCWSQGVKIRAPLVAGIGRYSYSIYLWHMPLAMYFGVIAPVSLVGFVAYVCLALAVGVVAATIIEVPVLHLRDRLVPSSAAAAIEDAHQDRNGYDPPPLEAAAMTMIWKV